jgi:hypothetical protein
MKRNIALGAAWTASAAAAVGLGFLAVSLVDASASPGTQPVAATTTAPTGSPSSSSSAPDLGTTAGERVTVGGTVFASCIGGVPSLAGAPATGWWVDDSDDAGEVEFTNGTRKVEVHTVCAGDVPQFSVEGPRADDSGRGDGSSSSSSSSPASGSAGPTSGPDDSDGRNGGGHGSDDSGPDDSSGRGGGGGGSDDGSGDDSSGRGGGSGSDD